MKESPEFKKGIANNINIWLDSYNDIFSDFDSRPIQARSLSDDFIHEAKKMAKEKPDGNIELLLLMPKDQRNTESESIIIKNIHAYFRHTSTLINQEQSKAKKRGIMMSLIGFALMILVTYLSNIENHVLFIKTLRVVLEPACWFLVWTGLDHLYDVMYKKNPDYQFNLRMSLAKISFHSY